MIVSVCWPARSRIEVRYGSAHRDPGSILGIACGGRWKKNRRVFGAEKPFCQLKYRSSSG